METAGGGMGFHVEQNFGAHRAKLGVGDDVGRPAGEGAYEDVLG